MKITKQVVKKHGLKTEEYKNIKKLLKREPNLLELGIFSAMWNEHCSYKSSKIHLKKLPTKNKNILGMMPHPERMIEKSISGDDGINLFSSLFN